MSLLSLLTACFILLTPTVNGAISNTQDLRELVNAYVEAHNEHDIDRVMSMFADTVRYEEEGLQQFEGKAEVRNKELWDKAVNGQLEVYRLQVRGRKVTGTAVEYSDYYSAAGLESYNFELIEFEFEGGLIKQIKVVATMESNSDFANALAGFVVWAASNKASELENLKENGMWAYSPATAQYWVSMLREWKSSEGQ